MFYYLCGVEKKIVLLMLVITITKKYNNFVILDSRDEEVRKVEAIPLLEVRLGKSFTNSKRKPVRENTHKKVYF